MTVLAEQIVADSVLTVLAKQRRSVNPQRGLQIRFETSNHRQTIKFVAKIENFRKKTKNLKQKVKGEKFKTRKQVEHFKLAIKCWSPFNRLVVQQWGYYTSRCRCWSYAVTHRLCHTV